MSEPSIPRKKKTDQDLIEQLNSSLGDLSEQHTDDETPLCLRVALTYYDLPPEVLENVDRLVYDQQFVILSQQTALGASILEYRKLDDIQAIHVRPEEG